MSAPASPPIETHQASRGYGVLTLVALVVTGMIGSGVFTTSGFALESLGSRQAVLAAWVVGGLIAVAGAVAYGGLASRLPQSGGEYLYLSRLLHPFAGFLAGMVSLTAGFSGGIAFAALTCQEYATAIMPLPSWLPDQTVATVVVLLACLIHVEAGRLAAGLNTVIVLVKVLLIAGLILWGYRTLGWSGPSDGQPLGLKPTGLSLGSFAMTVVWIMFSYTGFNEAVYVAAEARAPRRAVPLALLLGTVVTTLLYLALNDIFLRSAPADELAGKPEVAAIAAGILGGPQLEWWMRVAIVLSTLSAAAGMTMAGSRVAVAMADDRLLPTWFSGQPGRRRAVLLQAGLAVALVQLASIRDLLGMLGVTLSLCSAITAASLFLREPVSQPAADRTRPHAAILTAAGLYVLATVSCAVLMCLHDPWQLAGTAAIVLLAAVTWPLVRPQS